MVLVLQRSSVPVLKQSPISLTPPAHLPAASPTAPSRATSPAALSPCYASYTASRCSVFTAGLQPAHCLSRSSSGPSSIVTLSLLFCPSVLPTGHCPEWAYISALPPGHRPDPLHPSVLYPDRQAEVAGSTSVQPSILLATFIHNKS